MSAYDNLLTEAREGLQAARSIAPDHEAGRVLRETMEVLNILLGQKTPSRWDVEQLQRRARRRIAEQFSRTDRERFILETLGDDRRMSAREIAETFDEEMPLLDIRHSGNVAPMLKDMVDRGELSRRRQLRGSREVFVYFRKTGLQGPIADLNEMLKNDAGEDS